MRPDGGTRALIEAFRDPPAMLGFDGPTWTALLPVARASGLLGRIGARADREGLTDRLPARIADLFVAARAKAAARDRGILFEADRIARALRGSGIDFVLLKGAAYVAAGLPVAAGRWSSDVDILVAREALGEAERRLLAHGWVAAETTDYDQHYYREWMHELPPLRHLERDTVLDLHHTILPPTGRLKPDPALLLQAAVPVARWTGARVLAPVDMVLHNVVHLFQDGELRHGLRELADLHDLLIAFGAEATFWPALARRAAELGLGRPLHYALQSTAAILGTPIDAGVLAQARDWAAPAPIDRMMRALMRRALLHSGRFSVDPATRAAREALYIRSHWLRMPPHLLTAHLLRKSFMRVVPAKA